MTAAAAAKNKSPGRPAWIVSIAVALVVAMVTASVSWAVGTDRTLTKHDVRIEAIEKSMAAIDGLRADIKSNTKAQAKTQASVAKLYGLLEGLGFNAVSD